MDPIDELLQNNRTYASGFDKGDLLSPPGKQVAVLACMDARMDIHRILGLQEGDAHVVRNAGGVASDDALRSLLISQRLLGTTAVMVVLHTDCGMLTVREDEVRREVEAEIGQALPFALHGFANLEGQVKETVNRIKTAAFLPHRDAVRGFVYDVETGSLQEVDVA